MWCSQLECTQLVVNILLSKPSFRPSSDNLSECFNSTYRSSAELQSAILQAKMEFLLVCRFCSTSRMYLDARVSLAQTLSWGVTP